MLKGCGIDLVEISRIKSAWERFGRRFLERVFTPSEQAYCLARKRPEESLAARFAAKEAVAKALGLGLGRFSWQEIEIVRSKMVGLKAAYRGGTGSSRSAWCWANTDFVVTYT